MNADIHGLVGAYAVDAVDEQERAAFEAHLAQCAECRSEVASLREAAAQLGLSADTEAPSGLRGATLSAARSVRPLPPATTSEDGAATPGAGTGPSHPGSSTHADTGSDPGARTGRGPRGTRRRATLWLASAAAAAAVLTAGLAWSPWDQPPARTTLSVTEQVLRADDAQRFEEVIDGARATVVRSPSLGRAVLIADRMPAAPAGKEYQLWFDVPGKGMVSAGMMPHEAEPTLTMTLQGDASTATGVGITVEPAGGSPAPTSAPVALIAFS